MAHCRLIPHFSVKPYILTNIGNCLKYMKRQHLHLKLTRKDTEVCFLLTSAHARYSSTLSTKTESNTGIKSWCKNTLSKVGVIIPDTFKRRDLVAAGHILLNGIYMKVDHVSLQKHAQLEDSFDMWLQIVYMHMWMLLTRFKQENRDGEIITNAMIALMWQDVVARLNKIEEEVGQNLKINKTTREYVHLLHTSFMMYDEGILKDDCTLAGSIWNQVYGNENIDIISLECLVHYIRFTMAWLDDVAMEVFVLNPETINWPIPKDFGIFT